MDIFYDGSCKVCSFEMRHYAKFKKQSGLHFIDITGAGFDAKAYGLDPKKVNEELHVRDAKGNVYVGVDAFLALWEVLPRKKFKILKQLVGFKPTRPIVDQAYRIFAYRIRPLLPKNKNSCQL